MVADGGAAGALAPVATYYGRSLEESYLIVDPVLPLLVTVGVAVDVLVADAIATSVGRRKRVTVDPRRKRRQR